MSLVGNLEDLGLGEILQIVSLSRKTGVLSLNSRGRDGSIYFRKGQVVRASSSTFQQSLGEVLIQKGVIDLALLRKALSLQQEQGFRERLGVILVRNFGVSQEIVEEVVREQIENVVFSLFAWVEGSFKFIVQDEMETIDGTRMDPLQFMLDQGLNPQFLAMEGTRILDEQRHAAANGFDADSSMADDGDLVFDLVDATVTKSAKADDAKQSVVLVDDDGPTLRAITEGLCEFGFEVHAMSKSEDTLIKVDTLCRGGDLPVVVIDLIMPKMDGSGVLGGIELLELLHNNFKDLRIIVISDYHHADAEAKVHDAGYQFLLKPRRVEINDKASLQNFISQLLFNIRNPAGEAGNADCRDRYNLGDELRIEMGDDEDVPSLPESVASSGGLSLLRGMLEELNNPELQGGILLLVLRFASEFFNRAIVFTVENNIVYGSGQFGISGGKSGGDERVRAIHFSLDADSIFKKAHLAGQSDAFKPALTAVDKRIFEQLGGGVPDQIFVGPIVSQSRLIGFLYGDNLPGKEPIADTDSLAIFLSQAGIAMEKAILERQLHERVSA
ncbi:MAG: response regulator [Geobacteraceae bacterium]|nr:response regulator [Geobacteraceae bacterium]